MGGTTSFNGTLQRAGQTQLFGEGEWDALSQALQLSRRELEILRGVFTDQRDMAIATKLGMSPHTVRTHFERLYRKLNVTSRVGLMLRVFATHRILQVGEGALSAPKGGHESQPLLSPAGDVPA